MKKRFGCICGFGLVFLGTATIVHFVVYAAKAGFPKSVLASGGNWLFIGFHAMMCFVGLAVLGTAARKRASGSTGSEARELQGGDGQGAV